MKTKQCGVISKNFALTKDFIIEVEKLGWKYNHDFTQLSEYNFERLEGDLHFCSDCCGGNEHMCSLSRTTTGPIFYIPNDWQRAIDYLTLDKSIVEVTLKEIATWKGVKVKNIRIKK